MKKFLVALVLASGVGAIAFASMSSNSSNKQAIEKNRVLDSLIRKEYHIKK